MTTILLAVLLSLLTYKLVDRALVTWRKENADFKRVAAATAGGPDATAEATRPLLQGDALEHQEILNSAFAPDGDRLCPPHASHKTATAKILKARRRPLHPLVVLHEAIQFYCISS